MQHSDPRETARRLQQAGIALFLLGLLTGFALPSLSNPRMGLASHLEGVMNGMFLVVLGLLWPRLVLSGSMLRVAFWLAIYGTFVNWMATLLAAMWAAGGALMPMAARNASGTTTQEVILKALLVSLSLAMVALCVIVMFGLRRGIPELARSPEQ